MFSGIVEEMATVTDISHDGGNIDLTLTCSFTNELKIDQSVSHNDDASPSCVSMATATP